MKNGTVRRSSSPTEVPTVTTLRMVHKHHMGTAQIAAVRGLQNIPKQAQHLVQRAPKAATAGKAMDATQAVDEA